MGIVEVVSAPASPWQNPYVERVIGSIRRECLDHVIVLNASHLRRILTMYGRYYHRSRTHLGAGEGCAGAAAGVTAMCWTDSRDSGSGRASSPLRTEGCVAPPPAPRCEASVPSAHPCTQLVPAHDKVPAHWRPSRGSCMGDARASLLCRIVALGNACSILANDTTFALRGEVERAA